MLTLKQIQELDAEEKAKLRRYINNSLKKKAKAQREIEQGADNDNYRTGNRS